MSLAAIHAWSDAEVERRRDALFALSAELIAADSSNPPGLTGEVAAIVDRWLMAAGVMVERLDAAPDAANVIGRVDGVAAGAHVVFNAHMDTMEPGDVARWSVPPLALTHRDGRAYGHGMGNMKGALAAMCLATALVHERRAELGGRLSLTAVCDEVMFGDRGTVMLLGARPDLTGDFLISGEGPGYMGLAVAEKGLLWLDAEARGEGGHSSGATTGATAIARLAAFLVAVDPLNDVYAELPPELAGISGGQGEVGLRLSVNVGTVDGGTVRSQIATRARARLDLRLPPGIGADEAEARVRAAAEGKAITIRRDRGWDANWTGLDHPLTLAMGEAITAVRGAPPTRVVRLPGSDARRWRDLGVPAICYGPQPTLSAGIDDYAEAQDLIDCAKVYARAATALMTAGVPGGR